MDLYFRGVYNVLYSFVLSVACVDICVLCDMEVLKMWYVVCGVLGVLFGFFVACLLMAGGDKK